MLGSFSNLCRILPFCVFTCATIGLPLLLQGQPVPANPHSQLALLPLASEDDEELEFRPGVITQLRAGNRTATRIDERIAFRWGDAQPDPRISADRFNASFRGRLFTIVRGEYRLHIFARGKVTLSLAGKELLKADLKEPGWQAAQPLELAYGYHPLEIEFEKTGDPARIALFWEGPDFQLEPVPGWHLFHDPGQTPDSGFEQGGQLVRALRCAACHDLPQARPSLAGPSLAHLRGQLSRSWLVDWLRAAPKVHSDESPTETDDQALVLSRRMPHLGLSQDGAQAIAAYLFATAEPLPPEKKPAATKGGKKKDKQKKPTAKEGARLFRTLGCLACHQAGELGEPSLFAGPDLTAVAAKRPPGFFAAWLRNPARLNPHHRMPVFELNPREVESLSLHLQKLAASGEAATDKDATPPKAKAALVARGKQLVAAHRCGACHALPENDAKPAAVARVSWQDGSIWKESCLGDPAPGRQRPGYALAASHRQAIQTYLAQLVGVDRKSGGQSKPRWDGSDVLAERNCLNCHRRGLNDGIAGLLPEVAAFDSSLAPLLPAMSPPALNELGEKLHEAHLLSAIELKHDPLRPWLLIRMPKFNLSAEEKQALVGYFVAHDRLPPRPQPSEPDLGETTLQIAGRRLVTADGFGCTSCHKIGNSEPVKVALNAHGTDLSLIGKRIRKSWFDRWTRNPARIVPRMEMPAIKLPVRGVLGEDVDHQLAAVWHVLNQPGFNPPKPNPLRVVRNSGLPDAKERTDVLTDVLRMEKGRYIKPFLLGLPNRHNALFDLAEGRLAEWWTGDGARQRTEGKTWYWEAGNKPLWTTKSKGSELALADDGQLLAASLRGQFITEFDWFEHGEDGALQFGHRLFFPAQSGSRDTIECRVQQRIAPLNYPGAKDRFTGFRRRIEVEGLPAKRTLVLRMSVPQGASLSKDGRQAEFAAASGGQLRVTLRSPAASWQLAERELRATLVSTGADKPVVIECDHETALPVYPYPPKPVPKKPEPTVKLAAVPGFEAVQLPLDAAAMPTDFAWRPDGTLAIASLKGRVWLARDTDGDGLEDQAAPFSDEFAAPYGIAASGEQIDVLNKYGLLRLYDRDGDGQTDRTETIASGWGHTDDYHDWAVGLPRDDSGNYYVALPCQQDDRSPAAAHLRGRALRLVPTDTGPRKFRIEEICGGLRFPMGLALNDAGELFATDNQGNWNPFNELNHLQEGKRYGFINKLERKKDFDPPAESPAVFIPHPWTRSVNGICFLRTPEAVEKKLGQKLYGPLEGHLLGCEYDTRRVIRISLQRVGDAYQGCAYPFSLPAKGRDSTFQGPVCVQVAPDGDIYVGSMRDSGWGGGSNNGSVVRLKPTGKLPPGIAEIRATAGGFRIHLTQPVDREQAGDPANYDVSSYRRISTPAYGGPDQDRRREKVESVRLAQDGASVEIKLGERRLGFVYEIRVKDIAPGGKALHPAEGHYTLHRIPD